MTLLVVWSLESLGPIAPPISITPFPVGDVVNVGLVIWNGNSGPEKNNNIVIFQPEGPEKCTSRPNKTREKWNESVSRNSFR